MLSRSSVASVLLIWHVATMLCTMGVGASSGTADSPVSTLYLRLRISWHTRAVPGTARH